MSKKTLDDLFVHTLKDIYFAEKQIKKMLPKMIENAGDGKLRGLFEDHLDETNIHVERLERAFESVGKIAAGERCPAIIGIIDAAEELIFEIEDANTRDAAMIGAARVVEHYEIARYGTICVWAQELGHTEVHNLLVRTLSEEKNADSRLSEIA